MRFLIALPFVISGFVMLGMRNNPRLFNLLVAVLAAFSVFQFVVAANHLFAASHLALQADRLMASRLIERIENAQADADTGVEIKYMEMVGYYSRPSTELIPKIETFGASFFEWDQGSVGRVLMFLQTVGYQGLQPLPVGMRSRLIEYANNMSIWPKSGSVRVVSDTVLVKFGEYSYNQKVAICTAPQKPDEGHFDLDSCMSNLFIK